MRQRLVYKRRRIIQPDGHLDQSVSSCREAVSLHF
jgi:hypothetical protein